jgi:hypothetical protein
LHITRAKHWAQNEGLWISPEEWISVVEADPELRSHEDFGPLFAVWTGESELVDPWLEWFNGNIDTKNPDAALIEKMVQIAKRLGARVQGDEGEIYPGNGQPPYFESGIDWE